MIRIAIDVAGGDFAPLATLKGADLFLNQYKEVSFLLFGDQEVISRELKKLPNLENKSQIYHTEFVIKPNDKPSFAVRNGKGSSMWQAIEAVRHKEADVVISAGNTGALMAIAKILLKTLPNINRPAIASTLPTKMGNSVMLDLGANADCDAEILFQFALMGNAFAKALLGIKNPKIGLLNIGSEDTKGNDSIKLANVMVKECEELSQHFYGYIEGDDIAKGIVDVIVTDGFSGNVALKSIEGTAKLFADFLKKAANNSLLAKLGFLLARPSIKSVFKKFDPQLYNGAMFLGLNGIVIKSHGSANATSFASAIKVGFNLAKNEINQKVIENLGSNQVSLEE
jgi:glycerol-3-phosphate acyltransferase PlsX